jgi:hypothetical protein
VVEGSTLLVEIPYLNPFVEHGHIIKLSSIVDGPVENLKISGGGKGWSIRHVPLISSKRALTRLLVAFVGMTLLIPIGLIYWSFIKNKFGIDPWETSIRTTVAYLPLYLLVFVIGFWGTSPSRKLSRAIKQSPRLFKG